MLPSPAPYGIDKDAFCSGHAHDNTGGVIFQGGLLGYGPRMVMALPVRRATTRPAESLRSLLEAQRTGIQLLLPALTICSSSLAATPEDGETIQKLAYGTTAWTSTGVIMRTQATYPRVTLLPNGKLFVASPDLDDRKNYLFDPGTNSVAPAGNDVVPESEPGGVHNDSSWKGTGVLLPLVPDLRWLSADALRFDQWKQAWVKDLAQTNPTWQVMGTRPLRSERSSAICKFNDITDRPGLR